MGMADINCTYDNLMLESIHEAAEDQPIGDIFFGLIGVYSPRKNRFILIQDRSDSKAGNASLLFWQLLGKQPRLAPMLDQEDVTKPLHVFDLPQLHEKPTAHELLSAISLLALQPRPWSPRSRKGQAMRQINPEGIPAYLTRVIGSSLTWITDTSQQEAIWDSASQRLAERSGRSAMPAMERMFRIPRKSVKGLGPKDEDVEIVLHEPSLTADNLGLKTWAASYMLAKRLHGLDLPGSEDSAAQTPPSGYQVLELGAGTGLVGMAFAAVFGRGVVLTDLPEIEHNMARNVETNRAAIRQCGGTAISAVLDWTNPSVLLPSSPLHGLHLPTPDVPILQNARLALPTPPDSVSPTPAALPTSFPIILAADCIYSPDHPAMLATTIDVWLSRTPKARVIIELPLRSAYSDDVDELRKQIQRIGLALLEEGEETGEDDWGADGDGHEEGREVRCWYGVWGWPVEV